jgi:hypothetical protein
MHSIYDDPKQLDRIKELKAELGRLKENYNVPENGGLPLRGKISERKPNANSKTLKFNFQQGVNVKAVSAPYLPGRGIQLTVPLTWNGKDGVLIAQGGASNGYALWIKDGRIHWTVTRNDAATTVSAEDQVPIGQFTITVRQEKSGEVTIALDGRQAAKGNAGGPFLAQPFDGLSIGEDAGSQIREFATNKYAGEIGPVQIFLIK